MDFKDPYEVYVRKKNTKDAYRIGITNKHYNHQPDFDLFNFLQHCY